MKKALCCEKHFNLERENLLALGLNIDHEELDFDDENYQEKYHKLLSENKSFKFAQENNLLHCNHIHEHHPLQRPKLKQSYKPKLFSNDQSQTEYSLLFPIVGFFIFPYRKNGDLYEFFKKYYYNNGIFTDNKMKKTIKQKLLLKISNQLEKAVEYVHLLGFTHRDVKTENVFIRMVDVEKNEIQVELADFGLCN